MKIMKKLTVLLMVLGLALIAVPMAQAFEFDFGVQHPQTSTATDSLVSYAGGEAPLIGTDIIIENVIVTGTTNDGLYPITDGLLNFTTGNLLAASPNIWKFDIGGSITLAGTTVGAGSIGMTGTFTDPIIVSQSRDPNTFHNVIGAFNDTKNSDWLGFFGVTNPLNGEITLSFNTEDAIFPGVAGFSSSSIDVGAVHNVPLPPAALLLGTGLLGMVGLGYRRKRKS